MIKREFNVFAIVGASTVLIDFVSYRGLIQLQTIDVDMAKAAGFMVGALFAYFANRFWTFGHKPLTVGSPFRFIVLYVSTLCANVLINSLTLKLIANKAASFQLAFLLATGISACLNFLGMKFFVFRKYSKSYW